MQITNGLVYGVLRVIKKIIVPEIQATNIVATTFTGNLTGNASTATTATSAGKLSTARSIQTNLASGSSASFDGSANVTPGVTGTLGVANGGTGQTTAQNAANAFINALSSGNSTPQDADYYVSQYAGGGTSTITYYRRPVSALWTYMKGKISSVLGLTATNYNGTAANASKATAVADYNDTNSSVQIGYSGSSLTADQITHFAAYNNRKIKDVSVDTVKAKLGLGSAAYTASSDYATSGHSHNTATSSAAGFMSADDKDKLNNCIVGIGGQFPVTSIWQDLGSGEATNEGKIWVSTTQTDIRVARYTNSLSGYGISNKVKIYDDSEGGNIQLMSPTDGNYIEMDIPSGNIFRVLAIHNHVAAKNTFELDLANNGIGYLGGHRIMTNDIFTLDGDTLYINT